MEAEDVVEQVIEIRAEADGYGHVAYCVFEDQIPADDPREDFAERGVGVRVGAAGHGNHRREFCVTQRREAAGQGH